MKSKVFKFALLAVIVSIAACEKDDHEHDKNDNIPPTISIIRPNESAFRVGDTVFIQINVLDNVELHEVDVFINDKVTGAEKYKLHRHSHSREVNINSWWIAEAGEGHADYVLIVTAEDAAGNKAERTHEFHVDL
ncbi:Ig-like domain-containing protein [Thermaurantimonas aggregans]|nr:Ig-like domain-containing protein [Thermaurantimonas aggregans]